MRAVKSVSIDSERRVIITYLDGSTETLYPNCIWCDSEALRQLIKDLLEEKADAITQTIENVTIASFADGADEGVIKKLLVSIEPIQEGSGDPSPENIRPISGWTGLTVYHSGVDTSDPSTISVNWETEAGTVYGGTLDVVSGKLTVNWTLDDLGQYDWGGNNGVFNFTLHNISPSWTRNSIDWMRCSTYKPESWISVDSGTYSDYSIHGLAYNNATVLRVYDSRYQTAADFKSGVSGTQFVYEIATSIEIQLTPQEIRTLLGVNNIWADSGNILELEYTADTKLYIGEKQSGTSGALGSDRQTNVNHDLQPASEKTLEDVEAYKEDTDERGEE